MSEPEDRWKLKTCRCGAEPKLVAESGMVDLVKCAGCGAEGPPFFDGVEWAIEAWNKGQRGKEGTYPAGQDYQI